jgi:chromosome segregation ATPase
MEQCKMSIASNQMAAAQAQFETRLDASPVLQAMQTGIAELTRRMSSLELRMDRDERQSEIAIERISALTGAVGGIDQRLIRVEERGVRLEEQLKAHTEQIQHNFDSLREHYDLRFDQVFGLLGQHEEGLIQNGQRLDRIEMRLDKIESRLDQMNKRFDQMDKRLDYMDQRFVRIEGKLDRFHWSVMAGLGVIVVQGVVMNLL